MPNINKIIEYESGKMEGSEIIKMFQEMLDDGSCWKLQGSYGRTAKNLIKQSYIKPKLQ